MLYKNVWLSLRKRGFPVGVEIEKCHVFRGSKLIGCEKMRQCVSSKLVLTSKLLFNLTVFIEIFIFL